MSPSMSFSRVEEQASEWLVKLSEPNFTREERHRFDAWLAADPEHERVFLAQQRAWSMAGEMAHLLEQTDAPLVRASEVRRNRLVAAAATLVLAVGALAFVQQTGFFGGKQFTTRTAQLDELRLEDGTVISLGAASGIRVAFSDQRREVLLLRGQAFFNVAHDAGRPFFVTADSTTVRVVGTKFDVTRGAGSVRVSVLEGRVEVVGAAIEKPVSSAVEGAASSTSHALSAGQGAEISSEGRVDERFQVARENLAAWRSGRLVYVDARLRDVVVDVERYYGGKILLAEPAVGDLRLTAAFRADQIDRMLEVLASALPIEVERVDQRVIRLSPRPR